MGSQAGVETFSILWFLIHLLAVPAPLRYELRGGACRLRINSARGDSPVAFLAARWLRFLLAHNSPVTVPGIGQVRDYGCGKRNLLTVLAESVANELPLPASL